MHDTEKAIHAVVGWVWFASLYNTNLHAKFYPRVNLCSCVACAMLCADLTLLWVPKNIDYFGTINTVTKSRYCSPIFLKDVDAQPSWIGCSHWRFRDEVINWREKLWSQACFTVCVYWHRAYLISTSLTLCLKMMMTILFFNWLVRRVFRHCQVSCIWTVSWSSLQHFPLAPIKKFLFKEKALCITVNKHHMLVDVLVDI